MSGKTGSLMIIGGSEDRTDGKTVLERFVRQAGGPSAAICVLTAASTQPDTIWAQYDEALTTLGARKHSHLKVEERAQAHRRHQRGRLGNGTTHAGFRKNGAAS